MFTINFPEWDKDLFIYLNSKNHPWIDPVMVFLSDQTVWIILMVVVISFMVYKRQRHGAIASLFLIAGVAANSLLNQIVKFIIMRPRPGNNPLLEGLFNQLEATGTSYSFFSAHSSTSMCLAMFSALYIKNATYSTLVFVWAFLVAYSRIYVGKHYPLDVVVGILFGMLVGWLTYRLYNKEFEGPYEIAGQEETGV